MAVTLELLSGSTNGKAVKVAASSTPGTTIHTAVAGTTNKDEIYLYAVNTSTGGVELTLEWGETTSPDGNIPVTIPARSGLVLVMPGLPLQNGLVVKAFASVQNVIMISGYVLRQTA